MEASQKNIWLVEFIFLFLLLIFFSVFFFLALPMSRMSGLVPRVMCGFGLTLSLIQIVATFFRYKKWQSSGEKTVDDSPAPKLQGLGLFPSTLLALGYILCFHFLGFFLASFLALAFIPPLLGYPNRKVCIVYAALLSSALYVAFVKFFFVRLPGGLLWDMFLG